jgi:hypothetical protein
MASPHAAGALAVLLQLNPNLDAVEARSLLAVSSRGDAFTGVVPNMLYGWGKIFVPEGAAAAVKPVPDVSVGQGGSIAWTAEPHSVTYNLYRGSLPFTFPASYGACLQSSLPGTSWSDPAAPPPGSGYTYLVTGVKDGIEGSFGLDSAGGTRLNVAPCP